MSKQSQTFTAFEEETMRETFALAKKGKTSPNPMVGVILVKNGKVIGKGYHKRYGEPHAEVNAIKSAKSSVKGATMYISLEPCCHEGMTPPCTNLIIEKGIKEVVIASTDPFEKVNGKGVKILKKNGIKVRTGLFQKEAEELNKVFYKYHKTGLPYIILKNALSLNGKIFDPDKESIYLTGKDGLNFVHKLRNDVDAILVGINTVIKDDPHLGSKLKGSRDPIRIILDSYLKIPLKSKVLRDSNCIIFTTSECSMYKLKMLKQKNIPVYQLDNLFNLKQLMRKVAKLGITSVLVEGGTKLFSSFLETDLFDECQLLYSPSFISNKGIDLCKLERTSRSFKIKSHDIIGKDLLIKIQQ